MIKIKGVLVKSMQLLNPVLPLATLMRYSGKWFQVASDNIIQNIVTALSDYGITVDDVTVS